MPAVTLPPPDDELREALRLQLAVRLAAARSHGLSRWVRRRAAAPAEVAAAAAAPAANGAELLAAEAARVACCTRCPGLATTRTQTVYGVGDPRAPLMLVGEAPGADEDRLGEPFVGRAGQLLTKMLAGIGLPRERVYIANILKCRPPGNREPLPDEKASCTPYLHEQIRLIGPRLLVALGAHAARHLLATETSIGRLRGRFHDYRGVLLMPTYHPAYLLRNPGEKAASWEDLKLVRQKLRDLRVYADLPGYSQP
ncbi:MAG: uracil-DNA glycosylase [Planctomycetes bacterium]|nr:uracil-DNA glycosylase [Planctomycetota bacterium]